VVEAIVFKFTGVSLGAARALAVCIFGAILAAVWLLLRRFHNSLTASLAVLLLAVSPFCFAFTRLAILEPLLVLLMLLALLAASYAKQSRHWPVVALGLLLPLMVLTKTTAIFLLPAVFFLLLATLHGGAWVFARQAGTASAIAATIWGGYFALFVRPHYLDDYLYLFSANTYTGIQLSNWWSVLVDTFQSGMWMDLILYPAFAVLVIFALASAMLDRMRWLRRHLLLVNLLIWAAGYFGFLAYHDNIQPRYYLVVAIPMTMSVAIGVEALAQWLAEKRETGKKIRLSWSLACVCAAVLLVAIGSDARLLLHFVRTPEYTFLDAARQVQQIVDADRGRNRMVMSISGNDITLMTGVPSICDDFGTMELEDRIAAYRPGWYVTWNQVEDDKQEALDKYYRLERVAEIPAMDDPDRNLLIVYKLLPLDGNSVIPLRSGRRHVQMLQTSLDFSGPRRAGQLRMNTGGAGLDFSGLNPAVSEQSILDYLPQSDAPGAPVQTTNN
jgi:hypothetical protein